MEGRKLGLPRKRRVPIVSELGQGGFAAFVARPLSSNPIRASQTFQTKLVPTSVGFVPTEPLMISSKRIIPQSPRSNKLEKGKRQIPMHVDQGEYLPAQRRHYDRPLSAVVPKHTGVRTFADTRGNVHGASEEWEVSEDLYGGKKHWPMATASDPAIVHRFHPSAYSTYDVTGAPIDFAVKDYRRPFYASTFRPRPAYNNENNEPTAPQNSPVLQRRKSLSAMDIYPPGGPGHDENGISLDSGSGVGATTGVAPKSFTGGVRSRPASAMGLSITVPSSPRQPSAPVSSPVTARTPISGTLPSARSSVGGPLRRRPASALAGSSAARRVDELRTEQAAFLHPQPNPYTPRRSELQNFVAGTEKRTIPFAFGTAESHFPKPVPRRPQTAHAATRSGQPSMMELARTVGVGMQPVDVIPPKPEGKKYIRFVSPVQKVESGKRMRNPAYDSVRAATGRSYR